MPGKKRGAGTLLESVFGKNWIAILTLMGALAVKAISSTSWLVQSYPDKVYVDQSVAGAYKYTDSKFADAMKAIDQATEKAIAHSDRNKAEMTSEIREVGAQVKEMKDWLRERMADRRAEKH